MLGGALQWISRIGRAHMSPAYGGSGIHSDCSVHAGALGERRELARGPLEETARFTQQTLDNFKESSEVPAGMISKIQEFGSKLASQLFD